MKNEMRPPHLAVGQDVEPELLLLAQTDDRRVLERLLERIARHAERDLVAVAASHDGRGKLPTLVVAKGPNCISSRRRFPVELLDDER